MAQASTHKRFPILTIPTATVDERLLHRFKTRISWYEIPYHHKSLLPPQVFNTRQTNLPWEHAEQPHAGPNIVRCANGIQCCLIASRTTCAQSHMVLTLAATGTQIQLVQILSATTISKEQTSRIRVDGCWKHVYRV